MQDSTGTVGTPGSNISGTNTSHLGGNKSYLYTPIF